MLDENLKILDDLTLGRSWLNIHPPGFSSLVDAQLSETLAADKNPLSFFDRPRRR